MYRPRRLLHEEITYSVAKQREVNILHQLGYYDQRLRLFTLFNDRHTWMQAIVAHHLCLDSPDVCHIPNTKEWLHGSFNACIPITVADWTGRRQPGKRVMLRFPLPFRIGEDFRPGNADEKIQCEAGTYAWLQENCPEVPIPRLYGFALSTGETFTHIEYLPPLRRYFEYLRRWLRRCFRLPVPSNYIRRSNPLEQYNMGYMLIECIEADQGTMLSKTWSKKRDDVELRANFFKDLSRILLSIARVPQPRIGSYIIDKRGFLTLTNRPLKLELQDLENENIPIDIPRDLTYSNVDSYVIDVLGVHDSRLRHQLNAVNDVSDCGFQMASLAAMRSLIPVFYRRDLRRGPFVLTLTDLHQSNIFVDDNWHITCLIDLEWACSRPVEMVDPPFWLSNKYVDLIDPEQYDQLWHEMMTILRAEEAADFSETLLKDVAGTPLRLSDIMDQGWVTGTFWFTLALSSPTGIYSLFNKRLRPLLSKHREEDVWDVLPFYWIKDATQFAKTKISDKKKYDKELELAFVVNSSIDSESAS